MRRPTAPDGAPSEGAGRQPAPDRPRRGLLRLAAWVLIPLLLLAMLVFVVPTYAARYIAGSQLEGMGVATEGINTLKIDVWSQEVWLGPVQFRGEAAPFGHVEELGLKLGVMNLFQRQALIRELVIKGVDLQLTRDPDGKLILNGVDLRRQAGEDAEKPADQGGKPWGAGIDEVRIVDSRMFFTDRARGTIEFAVSSLELDEFRSWEPEHAGRFLLEATINNMNVRVQGTAKPFSEVASADAEVTVDEVEIEKIARYTGPLGFDRRSGVLRADLSTTVSAAGSSVEGTVKGEIVNRDVDQSRPDQVALQFGEAVLLLDHTFRLARDGTNALTGPLKFSIKAANLSIPGGSGLSIASGEIDLPALSVSTGADRTEVATEGSIRLAGVEAQAGAREEGGASIAASNIRTEARDLRLSSGGGNANLAGAVSVTASALQIEALQPGAAAPAKVAADRAALALANLAAKTGGGQSSVDAAGTVDGDKLSAELPATGGKPATEVRAEQLHVDLREVAARIADPNEWRVAFDAAVDAFAAAVGGGEVAKASLSRITLAGGRADQAMRIGGEELSLAGMVVEIKRAPPPEPVSQSTPEPVAAPGGGPAGGSPSAAQGPKVSLGRFTLADPAKASFTDGSVSPPVRMGADIKTVEVTNLNMEDPEQRTDMRLSAVVNGFSRIDASGWATLFAPSPSFDVLAQVKDLELPPLSPYAAQAVGVNIDGGRLNLKADAKAERAALDGVVQIDLRGLAFGALSKEDEERLSAKVGVPINTAVSLLQDAEGKIDLRVPISGNLASPDFDLSDAIGQAVTGAMTAAVTAPFKLIFEPVNMIGGGGGSGLALKPISFAAGEATLTPEGRVFVDSLAKLLQQRPKFTLRVCGKSTEQDVAALRARGALPQPAQPPQAARGEAQARAAQPDEQTRAQLTRLAEDRTRTVRQYLAERARVPVARIGECRAAFEPQSKAGPRAEASF
jgi:hypothetical protein